MTSIKQQAQHHSKMTVELNTENKTLLIKQEITFFNESNDTLKSIVLNDWNNAYSNKNTPLAKRFSDEFYRGFHLAKEEERGSTSNLIITTTNQYFLPWNRTEENPDYVVLQLQEPVLPNQKITFHLSYLSKIPSDKFTKYGYNNNGILHLKNWYLTPARYENHAFVTNSNNNLDDIANAISDFEIELTTPAALEVTSDLNVSKTIVNKDFNNYKFSGRNRTDFSMILEPKSTFESYKNASVEVLTDLKNNKLDGIQKAIVIDRIVTYVNNLKLRKINGIEEIQVQNLPSNPKISNVSWPPNEKKISFSNTTASGISLWVIDVAMQKQQKLLMQL